MEKNRAKYVRNHIESKKKNGGTPKVTNLIKDDNAYQGEPPKGEAVSKCKTCGRMFNQDFYPEMNRYSDYKTCHSCRRKVGVEKQRKLKEQNANKEQEVSTVTLPFNPHPWQQKAFEDFQTHRFNLWACGNRCLLEGDFIQGCNKPIEQLEEGDTVYDFNGNEQKVKYAGFNYYYGDVYTIKTCGCIDTVCNDEHRVYVCRINKKTKECVSEEFVHAKNLKEYCDFWNNKEYQCYCKIPKIKKEIQCDHWTLEDGTEFPVNEETAWVLGLYCAEGCMVANSLKWTLNVKEPQTAQRVADTLERLGYHTSQRIRPDEGTHCVLTYKRILVRKVDAEIGHGSINKHIPKSILFNSNREILVSFLKGYFAGDGWYNAERSTLTATTVSKHLALDIQTAFVRLGYFTVINCCKRQKSKNADYFISIASPNAVEVMGYKSNKKFFHQMAIVKDDCVYTPIRSVSKELRDCKIYNIETEDGSFVHNNQITGNSGKDFCANMIGIWYFVQCLNENRAINHPEMAPSVLWWIIAPTEALAKQNWRDLKKQFPKEWIVACADSAMTMQTVGGGVIEVRSAFKAESLVGVGLDLVTITEAARINDLAVVWANLEARLGSPGRGLEKDRKGKKFGAGKAIINSTPIGKNYFYTMWKWGQKNSSEYSSAWISYQLPWTCNPANEELARTVIKTKYGEMEYEEDLRRRLGERLFRQNYLADFLAMDGTVFKSFEENCVQNLFDMRLSKADRDEYAKKWKEPVPYHMYRIGYDPATGSSSDTPAVVIRDMDTNRIVQVIDLYGKNYDAQWDEIAFWSRKYNFAPCAWLRTGHTAVENQLAKRGVIEIPLDEQGGKKGQYIQSLERAIQNHDLHVLIDGNDTVQTFVMQMNDYTEKDGKYSNEQEAHDDFVSACYAAYYDYSEAEFKVAYCSMMGFVNRQA